MIHTKRDLQQQINDIKHNVIWRWEIDKLQAQIGTLQRILIDSGILVDQQGVHNNLIIVDGKPYTVATREEYNASTRGNH